eukprot:SM000323S12609  [mRNA]  locus=s323:33730:35460:+ [translate_table: standard]
MAAEERGGGDDAAAAAAEAEAEGPPPLASMAFVYRAGTPMAFPLGIPVTAGGVQRMWEGGLCDCLEDPHVTAQTACCPWVTFGQNMHMAGFGSCAMQGLLYFALTAAGFISCQVLAFTTGSTLLHLLGVLLLFMGTIYGGYRRVQMRRRFNIYGDEFSDYTYQACCSWCSLCQEKRTLQVNNVHNGIWTGRGSNMSTMVGTPFSITVGPQFTPAQKGRSSLNEESGPSMLQAPATLSISLEKLPLMTNEP